MTETAAQPGHCRHCGQVMPSDRDDGFCCSGCAQVYELLHTWGLDNFYQLRDQGGVLRPESQQAATPDAIISEYPYSGPAFTEAFIQQRSDGRHAIDWHVGGIHCAACVWLLEAMPRLHGGIISARVEFGSGRLHVVYEPTACPPAQQAKLIAQLGYQPQPWGEHQADASLRKELRGWLLRFVISAASAASAMHLAFALFAGHHSGDMDASTIRTLGLAVWAVSLPAIIYGGWPFYRAAAAAWRLKRPVLEHSVVFVVITALALGAWNVFQAKTELYVDALAMFMAFLLGGRLALVAARQKVAREQGLHGLLPTEARRPDGQRVLAKELQVGNRIVVLDGEVIATDGEVEAGQASIDGAVLTGEPRPIAVAVGDAVHAGCRVLGGPITVRCTTTDRESRLGQLLSAVREGSWQATPRAALIDRLQRWYVPAMLALASLTALWWWYLDSTRMLDQTMALILACCPCALGLATPLTYALAVRRAARRGWMMNDGGVIEALATPRHIVLDKTGTCTEGRIAIEQWQWLPGAPQDDNTRHRLLAATLTAERRARHPLALAVVAYCEQHRIDSAPISDWQEIAGKGVCCRSQDGELKIGQAAWTGLSETAAGDTFAVALDNMPIATVHYRDPLLPDLNKIIPQLQATGAELHLLSGDSQPATTALANHLGIQDAHGRCTPEDKAERVTLLRSDGPTIMIGDGINDRLALDAADVGIGVRGGIEAATACCQIYLAGDGLRATPDLIAGAKRSVGTLHRALGWSIFYNVLAIAAVVAGVWGPYVCAVAMPVSSVLTIVLVSKGRGLEATSSVIPQKV